MRRTSLILASLLFGILVGQSAKAEDIAIWVSKLKCKDLITKDAHLLPDEAKFRYWFQGFLTGVSSLAPVNLVTNIKFSTTYTLLLATCKSAPARDWSAVGASLGVAEMIVNLKPSPNGPIHLKKAVIK